jgi:hypothetical protein
MNYVYYCNVVVHSHSDSSMLCCYIRCAFLRGGYELFSVCMYASFSYMWDVCFTRIYSVPVLSKERKITAVCSRCIMTEWLEICVNSLFCHTSILNSTRTISDKCDFDQWVPRGGGGSTPASTRNSEVLTKLSRIPSSMENTSVTT